jgi:hypothetical protein
LKKDNWTLQKLPPHMQHGLGIPKETATEMATFACEYLSPRAEIDELVEVLGDFFKEGAKYEGARVRADALVVILDLRKKLAEAKEFAVRRSPKKRKRP